MLHLKSDILPMTLSRVTSENFYSSVSLSSRECKKLLYKLVQTLDTGLKIRLLYLLAYGSKKSFS